MWSVKYEPLAELEHRCHPVHVLGKGQLEVFRVDECSLSELLVLGQSP